MTLDDKLDALLEASQNTKLTDDKQLVVNVKKQDVDLNKEVTVNNGNTKTQLKVTNPDHDKDVDVEVKTVTDIEAEKQKRINFYNDKIPYEIALAKKNGVPKDICNEMYETVKYLSECHIGAFITFSSNDKVLNYAKNGTEIDAPISKDLFVSIFYEGTDLHDGACIVQNGIIKYASVFYDAVDTNKQNEKYGARHRTAIGLSSKTDSVSIVVSEETGRISFAANGKLDVATIENFKSKFNKYITKELNESEFSNDVDAMYGDALKATYPKSVERRAYKDGVEQAVDAVIISRTRHAVEKTIDNTHNPEDKQKLYKLRKELAKEKTDHLVKLVNDADMTNDRISVDIRDDDNMHQGTKSVTADFDNKTHMSLHCIRGESRTLDMNRQGRTGSTGYGENDQFIKDMTGKDINDLIDKEYHKQIKKIGFKEEIEEDIDLDIDPNDVFLLDEGAKLKYFDYVHSHINNVKKGYRWLKKNCPELFLNKKDKRKTNATIMKHDLSKYGNKEFKSYAKHFYGTDSERQDRETFNKAWNHHQKINKHHWQYWVMVDASGNNKVLDMPFENIVEMICDWWSFSWRANKPREIFNWYAINKPKMILSDKTRQTVEMILNKIKVKLDQLDKEKKLEESFAEFYDLNENLEILPYDEIEEDFYDGLEMDAETLLFCLDCEKQLCEGEDKGKSERDNLTKRDEEIEKREEDEGLAACMAELERMKNAGLIKKEEKMPVDLPVLGENMKITKAQQQYSEYLTQHINNVKRGYFWIKENAPEILDGCDAQKVENNLIIHDESKYSTEEYNAYSEFFYGNRTPEVKRQFKIACEHHFMNNKHHPEWWLGLDMDQEYIVEALCDWWSFSWKSGDLGDIFDYWETIVNTSKSKSMSDNTKEHMRILLKKLRSSLYRTGMI